MPVARLSRDGDHPLLGGGRAVLAEPAPIACLREPHSLALQQRVTSLQQTRLVVREAGAHAPQPRRLLEPRLRRRRLRRLREAMFRAARAPRGAPRSAAPIKLVHLHLPTKRHPQELTAHLFAARDSLDLRGGRGRREHVRPARARHITGRDRRQPPTAAAAAAVLLVAWRCRDAIDVGRRSAGDAAEHRRSREERRGAARLVRAADALEVGRGRAASATHVAAYALQPLQLPGYVRVGGGAW